MATISKADYLTISGYLADLRTSLDTLSSKLYNSLDIVAKNDDVDPSVDLIIPFNNVYINQTRALDSNSPYLDLVRALNQHIVRRSGFASVDLFLASDETPGPSTVDQNWADMSSEAGFTITRIS